jgi:RES domain-containing protein
VIYLADTIDTAIKETLYHQDKYFQNLQGLHYDTVDIRCLKVTSSASVVDLFQIKRDDYSLPRRLGTELKKMLSKVFNITR